MSTPDRRALPPGLVDPRAVPPARARPLGRLSAAAGSHGGCRRPLSTRQCRPETQDCPAGGTEEKRSYAAALPLSGLPGTHRVDGCGPPFFVVAKPFEATG